MPLLIGSTERPQAGAKSVLRGVRVAWRLTVLCAVVRGCLCAGGWERSGSRTSRCRIGAVVGVVIVHLPQPSGPGHGLELDDERQVEVTFESETAAVLVVLCDASP